MTRRGIVLAFPPHCVGMVEKAVVLRVARSIFLATAAWMAMSGILAVLDAAAIWRGTDHGGNPFFKFGTEKVEYAAFWVGLLVFPLLLLTPLPAKRQVAGIIGRSLSLTAAVAYAQYVTTNDISSYHVENVLILEVPLLLAGLLLLQWPRGPTREAKEPTLPSA